jgi:hypothetical protein
MDLIQQSSTSGNSAQAQVAALTSKVSDTPSGSSFVFSVQTHSHSTWIIDSGATDHVCCDICLFDSLSSLRPNVITVNLPNGDIVVASSIGIVKLTPDLTQINVLFLPNFSLNLICAPKLTAMEIAVILLPKVCVL